MSLGAFLFTREEFDRYYNCSAYDVDIIPLEKRRNVPYAIILWSLGIFFEVLYIPCTWAIYRLTHEQHQLPNCYPFMCYLGVVDCSEFIITSFVMGYMSITGTVYCSNPLLNYINCSFGMCNTMIIILALNRCVVIIRPEWNDKLFKGRRKLMAWMGVSTVGGFFFVLLVPPVLFSSISATTYLNPHQFYLPDQKYYHNIVHISYNWFIVISIILVYTVFLINLMQKVFANAPEGTRKMNSAGDARLIRNETKASMQVMITCCFVLFTSLGFIYSDSLQQFGFLVMIAYVMYGGSPSLIYLSMNSMIRNRITRVFLKRKDRIGSQPTVSGFTHVYPATTKTCPA